MRLSLLLSLALAALIEAHSVLVYPGTRGNNLITNDTFPYGMQWMYPCKQHLSPGQARFTNIKQDKD